MKSKEAILARARHLLRQELDSRMHEATRRLPHLCQYNHRHVLDARKTLPDGGPNPGYNRLDGGSTIGLCMLGANKSGTGEWCAGDDWNGNICEDPIDAQRCPYFDPLAGKAEVVEGLLDDLSDIDWIQEHLPDLGALIWVLDDQLVPRLSWFERFKLFFWRRQLEPVQVGPLLRHLAEKELEGTPVSGK